MAGNLLVLVEHWRGQLSEITFEMLALGREAANALGVRLEAALLGSQVRGLAEYLGQADSVLYAEHPALAEPDPEVYAEALGQLCALKQPRAVLCPLSNVTPGVGTLLSARLQAPAVNFCKDLSVAGGTLEARSVLYGGKMEITVAVRSTPVVLSIRPGARPASKGQSSVAPPVEDVTVTLPELPRVRFRRYMEPETGDVDIARQEVLVAVGRGIQSKDNLVLAEELAKELGGVVCGSRPVIDQGWLPLSRQVGKSGVSVKAKLYVAAGISGAPEHVEGIRGAETIIAINTDPQAPIFNDAHYGIVGDALDVIPALTEAVRATKG